MPDIEAFSNRTVECNEKMLSDIANMKFHIDRIEDELLPSIAKKSARLDFQTCNGGRDLITLHIDVSVENDLRDMKESFFKIETIIKRLENEGGILFMIDKNK